MILVKDSRGRSLLTVIIVFLISTVGLVGIVLMKEELNRSMAEKLLGDKEDNKYIYEF